MARPEAVIQQQAAFPSQARATVRLLRAGMPHPQRLSPHAGVPGYLPDAPGQRRWDRQALAGRLCELSSTDGDGLLSGATQLVVDAQAEGEFVAWISAMPDTFFAPDAVESGVDLGALAMVRVDGAQAAGRVADKLLRSGAFGLVIVDLGASAILPTPLQGRLLQLARAHDSALLCLTRKARNHPSLGSMVSLRGQVRCERLGDSRFRVEIEIVKDKQHGPGWVVQREYCGPDGLH